MARLGKIKVFSSFAEEQEEKWRIMANRSVEERMRVLYELQRISFPNAFDEMTGKPKPIGKKITIKTPQIYNR